jgi:hypothetical protein
LEKIASVKRGAIFTLPYLCSLPEGAQVIGNPNSSLIYEDGREEVVPSECLGRREELLPHFSLAGKPGNKERGQNLEIKGGVIESVKEK